MAEDLNWRASEVGIEVTEEWFDYAGYRVRDMREPLGETRDYINRLMDAQFRTEGLALSGGWEPLSEDYAVRKFRAVGAEPILVRTHEMKDIVLDLEPPVWRITMNDAVFDPPIERAGWHQTGVQRFGGGPDHNKPNRLPARPILELHEEHYLMIEDIFEQWLDDLRSGNRRRGVPDAALRPPLAFG